MYLYLYLYWGRYDTIWGRCNSNKVARRNDKN